MASRPLQSHSCGKEAITIATDSNFSDCVVLNKDAFDPDRVFLEDIVEDDALPSLSLAVEGLTDTDTGTRRELEMDSADAINDPIQASTELPDTPLDPEQLEVPGWESSFLRKILGYFRF